MQSPITTTMEYKKMNKPESYPRVAFCLVWEIESYKSKETMSHGKGKESQRKKISTGNIRERFPTLGDLWVES